METSILDRREKRILWLGSAIIAALAMLPNLIGWLAQTPEMRFNGVYYNWNDVATYLVTIRSGMMGNWRFSLFFTPLPQEEHFVKLFYLLLGQLFRGFQISPLTVYTISLAVFNWIGCLVMYRFIAEFFARPVYRATAFLLAIFGSGLGWALVLISPPLGLNFDPVDLWLVDLYPFFNMGLFPHFAVVAASQLGFVLLFLRYRRQPRVIYPIGMALIGLLLQTIQPYAPMIPFLIVGGMILWDWIDSRRFPFSEALMVVLVGIVQIPLLVYNFWVFSTDPVWMAFGGQNQTLSPPFWQYLLGMFWLLLLSLPVLFQWQLFREAKWIGVLAWVVGGMVLAYLPWAMQRRFLLYYTLPLALLATLSIQKVIAPWMNRHQPILANRKPVLLILLVGIIGFSHVFWQLSYISSLKYFPATTFHPVEVQEGVNWLEEHTWEGSMMVCAPNTGLLAGVYADQKVYIAHTIETVGFRQRHELLEQFYQNEIDLSALEAGEVDWIFYGPYERQLGPGFSAPEDFENVFQMGDVTIYQRIGSQ